MRDTPEYLCGRAEGLCAALRAILRNRSYLNEETRAAIEEILGMRDRPEGKPEAAHEVMDIKDLFSPLVQTDYASLSSYGAMQEVKSASDANEPSGIEGRTGEDFGVAEEVPGPQVEEVSGPQAEEVPVFLQLTGEGRGRICSSEDFGVEASPPIEVSSETKEQNAPVTKNDLILKALQEHGPLTELEIRDLINSPVSVSGYLSKLKDRGCVYNLSPRWYINDDRRRDR